MFNEQYNLICFIIYVKRVTNKNLCIILSAAWSLTSCFRSQNVHWIALRNVFSHLTKRVKVVLFWWKAGALLLVEASDATRVVGTLSVTHLKWNFRRFIFAEPCVLVTTSQIPSIANRTRHQKKSDIWQLVCRPVRKCEFSWYNNIGSIKQITI